MAAGWGVKSLPANFPFAAGENHTRAMTQHRTVTLCTSALPPIYLPYTISGTSMQSHRRLTIHVYWTTSALNHTVIKNNVRSMFAHSAEVYWHWYGGYNHTLRTRFPDSASLRNSRESYHFQIHVRVTPSKNNVNGTLLLVRVSYDLFASETGIYEKIRVDMIAMMSLTELPTGNHRAEVALRGLHVIVYSLRHADGMSSPIEIPFCSWDGYTLRLTVLFTMGILHSSRSS